jgi:hypothetical protein
MLPFAKYNQNDQLKEDEVGKECSTHGEKRNSYRVLVRNPNGKSPLGRIRLRWEDNFEVDFNCIGCGGMDWVDLI